MSDDHDCIACGYTFDGPYVLIELRDELGAVVVEVVCTDCAVQVLPC